jgi:hypothetical protein
MLGQKMWILKYIFILIIVSTKLRGQNLVLNPSFETYTACPSGVNDLTLTNWKDTPNGTADYFNVCATSTQVGVPNNQVGSQVPSTGNAYCGFVTWGAGSNYREILYSQLLTPLSIGQKYFVSIKVSKSGNPLYNGTSTDKIGVKFTSTQFSANPIPINNSAHVFSSVIITDTTNWTAIKGTFIADSNYQIINIGNFFDDANTFTVQAFPTGNNYYYVDDICVSTDSSTCFLISGISNPNSSSKDYKVYPNPTSNYSVIEFQNPNRENYTLTLYDNSGQIVRIINNVTTDKIRVDKNTLTSGLYFFQLNADTDKRMTGKIVME